MANHWKQWDAKPEATARHALCSFGCDPANRRKRRDAKPEATGRSLRPMLDRLPDFFASEQNFAKKGRQYYENDENTQAYL